MRQAMWLMASLFLISGCVSSEPVISKSQLGNLQIDVKSSSGELLSKADIYVDGTYVGNPSEHFPILHIRRGERTIRVECQGFKTYEKKIHVLGDPNHQVLNVILEKQ